MAQMFEREAKSNGSIQFLLKESTKYQKGQYAIQLSYYKGKVYLHLQNNNNGRQTSLPVEIFDCLYEQYYTIHKAVEDVKKDSQGPPSPQLLVMTPRKRKRIVDLDRDHEF
ncbi:uncharacterized protein LOC134271238 [Saccostrea cucullata]|uniref:uncharacterized protein LOC134271238 n=1 Tax=Saccostrea cuccullata TaxID=36930 RepID=UPI002ED50038